MKKLLLFVLFAFPLFVSAQEAISIDSLVIKADKVKKAELRTRLIISAQEINVRSNNVTIAIDDNLATQNTVNCINENSAALTLVRAKWEYNKVVLIIYGSSASGNIEVVGPQDNAIIVSLINASYCDPNGAIKVIR